jgi:pyruvate dehydrogenase E1 component alpha subunit/2-oxoisovalerate dehydrogenase E1 component alpha subunit
MSDTKKTRSGQIEADVIEAWSETDEARALGLFQILDEHGHATAARVPALPVQDLIRMYESMVRSRVLDDVLMRLQRQGRISFYLEARGQEAGVIGAAHALKQTDVLFPALRESSAALHRGLPLRAYLAQMFGNANDRAHGRQMPCHPSSRTIRHVSTSASVASQMPHATGLAWAAKIRGESVVALCFVGDGGTSQDDFQSGLNFAAVFKAPVVFVCQNNQWAISTPVTSQTASRSIAIKGLSFGIPSVRADGNDVLGMYTLVQEAVEKARAGGGPTFIEAVTYRLGAHTASDDPARYRSADEVKAWESKDPLLRFSRWLDVQKILSSEAQAAARQNIEAQIRDAIAAEENAAPPSVESLFADVLAQPSWPIAEQQAEHLRVHEKSE